MTSFKRFGFKPVVKYAYIGISADRQRHNLLWQSYKNKYCICPIRIEIILGDLNIYWFYHGLAIYADILPLAIAHGKIFGKKGQAMVKSVYIQAPMNYFLNIKCHGLITVHFHFFNLLVPTFHPFYHLNNNVCNPATIVPVLRQDLDFHRNMC